MLVFYFINIGVVEGCEFYVVDVLWSYEISYFVLFGNFEEKIIIVMYYLEDVFVYFVFDCVLKMEDFIFMLEFLVFGVKVEDILICW